MWPTASARAAAHVQYLQQPGVWAYSELYAWHAYHHDNAQFNWQHRVARLTLDDIVTLEEGDAQRMTSASTPLIQPCTLVDPHLVTLADYSPRGLLKLYDAGERKQHLAMRELATAMQLNLLTTGYRYTVTPHFATLLDVFHWQGHLCSLFERADMTLDAWSRAPETPLNEPRITSWLFQLLFSIEAAVRLLQFDHHDLHIGNIMVRDVTGTPYANADWIYKRQGTGDYYVIPASVHQNSMLEVIDYDRALLDVSTVTRPELFARQLEGAIDSLDLLMYSSAVLHKTSSFLNGAKATALDRWAPVLFPAFARVARAAPIARVAAGLLMGLIPADDAKRPTPLPVVVIQETEEATAVYDDSDDDGDDEPPAKRPRLACLTCGAPLPAETHFYCHRYCAFIDQGVIKSI